MSKELHKRLTDEEMRNRPVGTLFMKREYGPAGDYIFMKRKSSRVVTKAGIQEIIWTRNECPHRILHVLRPDLQLEPGEGPIEIT